MRLNLREVPFSTRGSYMAFSYLEGKYQGKEVENGLYFRTVHGQFIFSSKSKACI